MIVFALLESFEDDSAEVEFEASVVGSEVALSGPTLTAVSLTSLDAVNAGEQSASAVGLDDSNLDDADVANIDVQEPQSDQVVSPVSEWESNEWVRPASLIEGLEKLGLESACAPWVSEVMKQVEMIGAIPTLTSSDVEVIFKELKRLSGQVNQPVPGVRPRGLQAELLGIQHQLVRQSNLWERLHAASAAEQEERQVVPAVDAKMKQAVAAAQAYLDSIGASKAWADYLLLDKLAAASGDASASRQAVARRALRRISSNSLTLDQTAVIDSESVGQLATRLRVWAASDVDLIALLRSVERYHVNQNLTDARSIAVAAQTLSWSPNEKLVRLGEMLEREYRRPNLQVHLSQQFLNRIIQDPPPIHEVVDDEILGTQITGRSSTATKLHLRFVPDTTCWRLGMEAEGHVASTTESYAGSATFYNQGTSTFFSRKLILVKPAGIRLMRAEAEAESDSELADVSTALDSVPLFGSLARNYARSQHDSMQYEAKQEVERKITAKARRRLDQEVGQRLAKGETTFRDTVIKPLRRLSLDPVASQMITTDDWIMAGCRLASAEQLTALTPPPSVAKGAWLSYAMHESAINNVFESLDLHGREMTLQQLRDKLIEINPEIAKSSAEELPEDVKIRFPSRYPVRVECQNDRLQFTLRISRLKAGNRQWRNFTVRGYYKIESDGCQAKLTLDGDLEIAGNQLRVFQFAGLRAIFSRILSADRELELLPPQIATAPRLKDLRVASHSIENGWLSVSLAKRGKETIAAADRQQQR